MSNITKEHALNIARKLNAEIVKRKNKAHDMAYIYYQGKIIAFFGKAKKMMNKNIRIIRAKSKSSVTRKATRKVAKKPEEGQNGKKRKY